MAAEVTTNLSTASDLIVNRVIDTYFISYEYFVDLLLFGALLVLWRHSSHKSGSAALRWNRRQDLWFAVLTTMLIYQADKFDDIYHQNEQQLQTLKQMSDNMRDTLDSICDQKSGTKTWIRLPEKAFNVLEAIVRMQLGFVGHPCGWRGNGC